MNVGDLLRDLSPLSHDDRMRRMAELGRRSVTDSQAAGATDDLEKGGFYERLLALQSCYGSRDGARALRALSDPSRTIQNRALKVIVLFGDDAQVEEALQAARPGQRLTLLRLLRRSRRPGPADGFLATL